MVGAHVIRAHCPAPLESGLDWRFRGQMRPLEFGLGTAAAGDGNIAAACRFMVGKPQSVKRASQPIRKAYSKTISEH